MPFAVAAAGIGAAGSIASGVMGANAAKSAASAQEAAAQTASNTELSMFDKTQANLQPFMGAGTNALSSLQKLLGIGPGGTGATNPMLQMLGIGPNGQSTTGGIDPSTFQSSPGYQFQLQQGEEARTNAAAASGGLGGNALKALTSFGQQTANQGWNQYLNNLSGAYSNLTGQLGGLVNGGQNAAAGIGNAAMATGAEVGGNQIGAGNAAASGIIGANNALTGGIGGAGNALMQYLLGGQATTGGGQPSPYGSFVNGTGPGTGTGIGNWWSGASGSAADQYASPYGATGFGMAPIVGSSGMMGGGV